MRWCVCVCVCVCVYVCVCVCVIFYLLICTSDYDSVLKGFNEFVLFDLLYVFEGDDCLKAHFAHFARKAYGVRGDIDLSCVSLA